jgi:hypothetical protein
VYKKANNIEILESLFNKIADNTYKYYINETKQKITDYKKVSDVDVEKMEEHCNKMISLIYKKKISDHRGELARMTLTDNEKYTLKYFDLNPNMVLIFDDCTDELKKLKSTSVVGKIFFQGRHSSITCLMACHNDNTISVDLRNNAFMTIFTDAKTAIAYFERPNNHFPKEQKLNNIELTKLVFTPLNAHQKMVYDLRKNKLYKYTAEVHKDFKFGCENIWKYCNVIKADPNNIMVNNKFIDGFH